MKLLYLTHSCPYPPNKGDRIRSFNILRYLSHHHNVKLIYPSFSSDDMRHAEKLGEYASSVKTVKMSSFVSRMKCISGLFQRQPLTAKYFYSRQIQSMVDSEEFDIALVDCSSMALYIKHKKCPKIIDFVDIDHEKWRIYAERERSLKSLVYYIEYIKLKRFENELSREFDYSFVISENERKILQDHRNVVVVPNGIDFQKFSPCKGTSEDNLIFTGAMDYFANIDGMLFFCKEIFPRVKSQRKDATLIIAGMNPAREIRRLAREDITVTGYVSDIRVYMAQASVCVVPLRIARGMQNKILEAMAMGVPVVATSAANQGIEAKDGKEIMIADDPAAFASATVTLLSDAELRHELSINAQRLMREKFSWETSLAKIDEVISNLARERGLEAEARQGTLVR